MLLSIIIPVHNSEKYVEKCVDSIMNQGLDQSCFEMILVENASTDKSKDVCNQLCEKYCDYQIRTIVIATAGVGNARNVGIENAKGQYIHFVDSDDWIEAGMYSTMLEQTKLNPSVIVTGIINEYEATNTQRVEGSPVNKFLQGKLDLQNFFNGMDTQTKIWMLNVIWNKWYDRKIISHNNLKFRTDIHLGEDFLFNCEYFSIVENCFILKHAFYHYMKRERATLVSRFKDDGMYRRPAMYNAYCKLYSDYGILEENQKRIDAFEGKAYLGTLYQVFKKQCPWNYRQKIEYIKSICESKHFGLTVSYLKEQRNPYYKLIDWCVEKRGYNILYLILALRKSVK